MGHFFKTEVTDKDGEPHSVVVEAEFYGGCKGATGSHGEPLEPDTEAETEITGIYLDGDRNVELEMEYSHGSDKYEALCREAEKAAAGFLDDEDGI